MLIVGLAGCPAFVEDHYDFSEAVDEACAPGDSTFGEHCYFVTGSPDDFDAARLSCEAHGAGWGLAEVSSAEEHDFAVDLAGGEEVWLGATDRATEGEWVWESGQPLWQGGIDGICLADFCAWDVAEPNDDSEGDCARLVDEV